MGRQRMLGYPGEVAIPFKAAFRSGSGPRPRGLNSLPRAVGIASAGLGLIVLFGWATGSTILVSLAPHLPAQPPWTALLFVLAGLALSLQARNEPAARRGARGLALTVGASGAAFLFEHLTGLDLGLDLLLFREAVLAHPVQPPHPGRVPEVASATWVLLSASFLSAGARGRAGQGLFSASATVALALASISILVHLFGHSGALYGVLGFTNPAAHTAVGLLALAVGALALRPDAGWLPLVTGDSVGAQAVRRLGPLIVGIPILVGFLAQRGQQAGLYTQDFRLSLTTFATTALLVGVSFWAARRLNGLEALTRAERERLETEARLRMAIEAGRLGAWSFDPSRRTVSWDARTREMFGAPDEPEVPVETFLELVHPEDRRHVSAVGRKSLDPAGDGRYDVEHRLVRPDGRTAWLAHDGQVIFDSEGRPVQALGVTTDITERKQAELHQQLLVNELNHRVKNTLATVQAIAAQSLRRDADPESAKLSFTARLLALSRAHDLLTQEGWEGADLAEAVRRSVQPFDDTRFSLEGPPVRLNARAALSLALAVHELGTNAAKYGALSAAEGRVEVRWTRDDAAQLWRLTWTELGGPPVQAPQRRGFGSRLIERGLAGELRGEVTIAYEPGGVVCVVSAPLDPPAASIS